MRIFATSFLLLLLASTAAHAAVVYGSLTRDGAPLTNQPLEIRCEGSSYTGSTDERGSYSINVREQGRCKLILTYQEQQVEATVYSQERPARHDFKLLRDGEQWILRRR